METYKIVIILVLGILIGMLFAKCYYDSKIRNLKGIIDLLRLEIDSKENKKQKVIKG